MPIERVPGTSSLIDILDRILDKGIVVDGWPRISLDGIDVMSNHARVVVVSSDSSLAGHSSTAQNQPAQPNAHQDRVRRSGGRRVRGRL
jgi:gas vesicle structural protein